MTVAGEDIPFPEDAEEAPDGSFRQPMAATDI